MTINEIGELSTTLLIGLGMFAVSIYLVYVMFGAFNMSRKKKKLTPKQLTSTCWNTSLYTH